MSVALRRRGRALAVATTCALLAAACGSGPATGDGEVSVVAAFYPLAYVAERVSGEHASVTNLTSTGAEPHDLELSPQDVAVVSEADLVVYEESFQPAVDDAVVENAGGSVLEVAHAAGADSPSASEPDQSASSQGASEGSHDGSHESHGDHGHADLSRDPHLWLDPTKLSQVTRAVADRLSEVDPAHADAYRDNAATLVAELRELDRDYRQGLADCERDTFVTSHAAFGHLAERYGLTMVPINGLSPDTEPSPGRLAELQGVVSQAGVTTIFSERLASPELARTLAAEVGVGTDVLDPIEGLSEETTDEDYFSLMRANLAALEKANGCT